MFKGRSKSLPVATVGFGGDLSQGTVLSFVKCYDCYLHGPRALPPRRVRDEVTPTINNPPPRTDPSGITSRANPYELVLRARAPVKAKERIGKGSPLVG
jgi:hypothetical protein